MVDYIAIDRNNVLLFSVIEIAFNFDLFVCKIHQYAAWHVLQPHIVVKLCAVCIA